MSLKLLTRIRRLVPARRFLTRPNQSRWPKTSKWRPSTLTILGGGALIGGIAVALAQDANEEVEEEIQQVEPNDNDKLIEKCRRLILMKREELGLPGVVVAVSVDGKLVWEEGIGYSDVENLTKCRSDAAMRIASISKPIAGAIAGRLIDQGKLDIDKDIREYLPDYPQKTVNNKQVLVTTRRLLSHLGGIRHYEKNSTKDSIADGEMVEFYIKDEYKTVKEALEIFLHDELENKPGTKFLYTTHGFTLLSAVLEAAANDNFVNMTLNLFKDLGMSTSYLGYHIPLIPNQARYYKRINGKLENAPYVDLSCKWAGGGMISTVGDLCKFGNSLLTSYQTEHGYISSKTMKDMWSVEEPTRGRVKWVQNGGYGLSWGVDEGNNDTKNGELKPFNVSHTGGACGASSILTIIPGNLRTNSVNDTAPSGVVVAMITNLQAVGLADLALKIGRQFSETWRR